MKKVAVIILSLVFSIMAFSQDVQYEDVVYLKNGSVIRFNLSKDFGLNISSSFKFQRGYDSIRRYDQSVPGGYYYERDKETYRMFTFKFGFSF